ncbi:hypothetical protein PQI23_07535 [Leucobacter sp. USCH14]|uniref:hypothetical protein n=1 Tax=Leucobacter sp. USCH14 TaxID=3024838 RepID=UPI0030A81855
MKFSKKLAGAAAIGAAAVLTFGGTAANAAQGDEVALTPKITLGAESFTVSGADCVDPNGTPGEFAVHITGAPEHIVQAGTANADGTWTTTITSPAESGAYPVYAECDVYSTKFYYAANEALVSKAAGVQLSVTEAKHYQSVDVSGSGFTPKENVRVEFRQNGKVVETLANTVAADKVGELNGTIKLGNTLAAGTYDVVFIGETSGVEYSAHLSITGGTVGHDAPIATDANTTPAANVDPANTGAKGSLATTGGENFAPLAIAGGVAALAVGAGAIALGRRAARTAE